ncbi:MAG TPA: sigma-70 family RNA polymerase sigma factor, partial [Ilumatobacteraceae bacterium]|nr:sigma-70 family RNA polymerase sigma factor [Ilumatobacteraceae bacterium]
MQPFEDVVAEHGAVVMRVCRAMLGRADADDAWAETFLAALKAYPNLRPESNVRGWLVTIAHRKAIDQTRTRARLPLPVGDVPETPSVTGAPVDHDTELWAALQALPF